MVYNRGSCGIEVTLVGFHLLSVQTLIACPVCRAGKG